MQKDAEKLRRQLERGRIAIVCVDGRKREALVLALHNSMALLHFVMPEDPMHFRSFVYGALNTIVDASGYSSKYSGLVLLEISGDCYSRTDMPMAVLELLKLTTKFHLVILCNSKIMVKHMACCAAAFGVPGVVELNEEEHSVASMIEQTGRRLGISFENEAVLQQTLDLYETASVSEAFNMEAFLKSLTVGSKITEAAIARECADEFGYIRMCRQMEPAGKKEHSGKGRRIGFFSLEQVERGFENVDRAIS